MSEAFKRRFLREGQGVEDFSGPTPGSAYAGMARDEYTRKIAERNARETGQPVEAPEAPAVQSAGQPVGGEMAQNSAQKGDLLGTAGGAMMMTGNPYAMAAGLGLQVVAAGEQNKRAAEEAQRKEYNDRIARRQQMMNQIAQMGIQ